MIQSRIGYTAFVAISVAAVSNAYGHQLWLNASKYAVAAPDNDGAVTLNAYVGWGHVYPVDELPPADKLGRIQVIEPSGERRVLKPAEGGFLVSPLTVEQAGAYVLSISHKGGYFTVYEENGEMKFEERSKQGLSSVKSSEYFQMIGKALVKVGEAITDAFTRPVGDVIEILPLTDPYTLTAGESTTLPVRVLLRGEPAANAAVDATNSARVSGPAFTQSVRTNADGEATIKLDREGPWLVKAMARTPARQEHRLHADEESFTATLTFAVRGTE